MHAKNGICGYARNAFLAWVGRLIIISRLVFVQACKTTTPTSTGANFPTDSTQAAEPTLQSIKQDVGLLDSRGQRGLARQKLFNYYQRNPHPELLQFWLTFDEGFLKDLETNAEIKSLTIWKPNKIPKYWRGKNQDYEEVHPVQTCALDKAKEIIAQFDELKQSEQQLKSLLEKRAIESTGLELKVALDLLDTQEQTTARLKNARCAYASYDVVSPYLARSSQLIYIANIKNTLGHSKEFLQQAAVALNTGAYGSLLGQCQQDVRMQFVEVWKEIKDTAGAAELEVLKTLQSYADTISGDKPTNVDAWWSSK
jgi:hypothetical protein